MYYSKNITSRKTVAIKYAKYQDINKEQLQIDIEKIKNSIGKVNQDDFKHLLKLERWGRILSFSGYLIIFIISFLEITSYALGSISFWICALSAASLLGIGNVSRWANVAHPILHGAYDRVPNIPKRYTKAGFAKNNRRYLDWLDWIKPEAWIYEHNIMHHYHLGEDEDPDNVENNLQWLIRSKTPMWLRYLFVYAFAGTWKFTYYAPNTLRILENKKRRKLKMPAVNNYEINPFKKNGAILWKQYILPYFSIRFIFIPLLFIPLGLEAVFNAFIITLIAEYIANLHSFLVIVPNHSAEDIYRFDTPHKSQGEFYLRQIMGSVNYKTGTNLIDFSHGWLNYQIEHHLFPNLPLSQYQKIQPLMKELCAKHNLEYRQENVFKRMKMTVELMVGKTQLLKVGSI
ncbi:fatty acid desaturase [Poseidonibacter lekithochrous]|nr:fatty acid desaturase [Poseidonibacter lekithochrous]